MQEILPKTGNHCFGCGLENPFGLKLKFFGQPDEARVWTEFDPPDFLSGAANMMHGGFIALLLDEASSKVMSLLGKRAVTRNIEVSYEKPVLLERPMRIEANLIREDGRKHWIESQILNHQRDVLARSEALFLQLSPR